MNDPGADAQGSSTGQTSNEMAETNTNFSLSLFPIEIRNKIWQYLSFKQRSEVHEIYWPNGLWEDVFFIKPDVFKYSQPLKHLDQSTSMEPCCPSKSLLSLTEDRMMNELAKTKFSSIALSFKSKTREQMIAFKTFLDLLPGMEVQDLVISSRNESCFHSFETETFTRKGSSDIDLAQIPGLLFLPEEDVWDVVDAIRVSREALANGLRKKARKRQLESMVKGAVLTLQGAQWLEQISSLANCSQLRSLILDVDFPILCDIWQKPISQCKLDILSIQRCFKYRPATNSQDAKALCSMVREARVLDLIDDQLMSGIGLTMDLITAASRTLKYLTITINLSTIDFSEYQASVITFPMLEHLRLDFWSYEPIPFRFDCPNLKTLQLKDLLYLQCFSNVSSIEMLAIKNTSYYGSIFSLDLLKNAKATKLHTLYLYETVDLPDFLWFFSKDTGLPRLNKIVILRSSKSDSESRLNFCDFVEIFRGRTQDIRKIDTLIWETEWSEHSFPSSSDESFIRTHLATNFNCIKGKQPEQLLESSSEIMREFVEHNSVAEKLEFFQQFL